MNISVWLSSFVKEAAENYGYLDLNPEIRISDPKFGDFQADGVFKYAKILKENPKKIAEQIFSSLQTTNSLTENVDFFISGPGFINFKLKDEFLCQWLNNHRVIDDFRRDVLPLDNQTIVIDYSSPNTAKQMHVGHLRSMNIGEAICRLLEFCGANVIRDNHLGDWGTQFGILIMAIKYEHVDLAELSEERAIEEIERLYKLGNALAKKDDSFLDIARKELVNLQNGDEENLKIWEQINDISYRSFQKIYDLFDIKFDYVLGESFYRDQVSEVCNFLEKSGIARKDSGALVVFFDKDSKFNAQPFIIRKADGASNYASTDLATVKYRVDRWQANRMIYVTDGRQQDHFQQLFLTIKKWFDLVGIDIPMLEHVWFGTILGEDGKAIKTRDGSPIYLNDLINESIKRAHKMVVEKNSHLSEEEIEEIASVIGISAIRYFDLAQNRTNDYNFSWENMLSFDGNTAVYLLYAVARLNSILSKVKSNNIFLVKNITTSQERLLARKLLCFPVVLQQTVNELRPHYLCTYLYELACEYSSFYNANRVFVGDCDIQETRLALCDRTRLVLKFGLNLLGIKTVDKM